MKTFWLFAFAILVAFVAGCASTSAPAVSSGPPANVAGTWTGGMVGPGGTVATMQLNQTGANVTGTINISGRPDVSGPLTGTVDANTVRFKLDSGYGSTSELNVKGDTITGVLGGSGVNFQRSR